MFKPMVLRRGFTLIELLVVLLLMGLAAALVAPVLLEPGAKRSPLEELIASARDAAARRGEVVYVRIGADGAWRMDGGADVREGVLARGRIAPAFGVPVTLAVSPIGTCAFDVETAAAARDVPLEPLTCELRTS